jgi:DNA replication protein DnaC
MMTIDLADVQLDALLKRLHLANARRAWRNLVQRAEREEWSYRDFLALLVTEEIAQRQQTRIARMVRRAHFPFFKTIDDFNFSMQSTVRLALLGSALAPDFVTEGRCMIFGGKPGRGKTHLAVAIAYRAIQNGFDALFVTAAELIDDLSAAFRAGRLAEALARYVHPFVLVVDEVGYLTYGTDAANMLFHVVNDRHRKKRAMIFTTNKPLSGWGRVLHDEDLAHAIVDRILERGRMLTLDGPSMRTRHLGLDDPTANPASTQAASVSEEGARISGIQRPEFPEPTPLDGLLVFLGAAALKRGGIIRLKNSQISYVLPITQGDFGQMLARIQRQSNMVVRPIQPNWTVQKVADEGSSSPLMARLMIGMLRLRDNVFDHTNRDPFDNAYDFVLKSLFSARDAMRQLTNVWQEHERKVNAG